MRNKVLIILIFTVLFTTSFINCNKYKNNIELEKNAADFKEKRNDARIDKKNHRIEHKCDNWEKFYGSNYRDQACKIIETSDGGFIFCGGKTENKEMGLATWIVKIDDSGNITWEKTFYGKKFDSAFDIINTTEGDYIVTGITSSNGKGMSDIFLTKLDSSGNIKWEKYFGEEDEELGGRVIQTSDGGYLLSGETKYKSIWDYDGWLIKLNSKGELLWDKTYGDANDDFISNPIEIEDGYVFALSSYEKELVKEQSSRIFNVVIKRTDKNGNIVNEKKVTTNCSMSVRIIKAIDSGYVISGTFVINPGKKFIKIIKVTNDFNIEWEKSYYEQNDAWSNSCIQISDGGFALCGGIYRNTNWDALVFKTDKNGNKIWEKIFGGESWDGAYSLISISDNCIILCGSYTRNKANKTDGWVRKIQY